MALTLRAITPDELDTFCAGTREEAQLRRRLAGDIAAGTARCDWCWVAEDGRHVLARHHWWGPVGTEAPIVLVPVSIEDTRAATELVFAARDALGVDEAWSEITIRGTVGEPRTDRADAVAVLEGAGFEFTVDRVRVEWTGDPRDVVADRGRLHFVSVAELPTDVVQDLFVSVADGSLDDGMRRDRERMGAKAEAQKRLAFLRGYPGIDGRLYVATTADGDPVGYVAAPTSDVGVIAEIGVAPPHRGHGYGDDLLAHALRVLSAAGVSRVVADTDMGNGPMRAAFARSGFREFARRWDWGWHRA